VFLIGNIIMNTNQVRNYLLYDRTAMDVTGLKLEYFKAAMKDENWHQFLLSDEYDNLLETLKVNPYERAHQAFRREESHDIIKSVDKKNMIVTMLDGSTRRPIFFENSFLKMQQWIQNKNSTYNYRKRMFIKEYLGKFKKKKMSNYELATNKLGDFLK
jgi:hypothetical protein